MECTNVIGHQGHGTPREKNSACVSRAGPFRHRRGCFEWNQTRRREIGSTYTIFWKGMETSEQYIHGVGFAMKKNLVGKQNLIPIAISERLMTLRLSHDSFLTSFPSMHLPLLLTTPPMSFSMTFSSQSEIPHGSWFLASSTLAVITIHGEVFSVVMISETGMQTGSALRSLCRTWVDYDQHSVQIMRSKPGADDCWTSHHLLVSRLKISVRWPFRLPPTGRPHRRFYCVKLQDSKYWSSFDYSLKNEAPKRIESPSTNPPSGRLSLVSRLLSFNITSPGPAMCPEWISLDSLLSSSL